MGWAFEYYNNTPKNSEEDRKRAGFSFLDLSKNIVQQRGGSLMELFTTIDSSKNL